MKNFIRTPIGAIVLIVGAITLAFVSAVVLYNDDPEGNVPVPAPFNQVAPDNTSGDFTAEETAAILADVEITADLCESYKIYGADGIETIIGGMFGVDPDDFPQELSDRIVATLEDCP